MSASSAGLRVAITGPTGTFGFGLVPILEADERIASIVGVARRPFDPTEHGWSKMTYRQGDVRDVGALTEAFEEADVVVHLAFLITGTSSSETARAINVDGTLNAFRAAAAAGVRRFVYASSVAAYGFHDDNPDVMTEDWPTRPDHRFFYAEEKAELESLLTTEAAAHPEVALYLLRPPIVLGPHAVGGKDLLPAILGPIARGAAAAVDRLPVALPVPLPNLPMQFVHEQDVGRAFVLCIVGAGPPGAYNIAGDGIVTVHDVAREAGLAPLPLPDGLARRTAGALAGVPRPAFVPPIAGWVVALSRSSIVDTTKARDLLGWQPAFSGLAALRSTLHP